LDELEYVDRLCAVVMHAADLLEGLLVGSMAAAEVVVVS
jgi:hypothetical protein